MGHRAAAQHTHLHLRIEECEVDGGLHVVDLLIVLGVQAVVAAHREICRVVSPLQADRLRLEDSRTQEFGQQPQGP
ncbi:hypothetical protein [Streptomyces sp. C8S0]|uniref:hypothetical protein n=1 Tax=Streptomyces sp. C8S0 TaxID=2585716 RepID=UPI001D042E98|nr:hypothetical protein [Streptomyces sp. C8S0]